MSVTVRGHGIGYVNNANTFSLPLPAGSAAGDRCVAFATHGFNITIPTGWTQIFLDNGGTEKGAAFHKLLTAADITAGSITVTFAGTYYGIVAGLTFVGDPGVPSASDGFRSSDGATEDARQAANALSDYGVYFAGRRANTTITCSVGTQLDVSSNANASGYLGFGEIGSPSGTAFFNYGTSTGDYFDIIVAFPDPAPPALGNTARLATLQVETLAAPSSPTQVAGFYVMVLNKGESGVAAANFAVEVLRSIETGVAPDQRRRQLIEVY